MPADLEIISVIGANGQKLPIEGNSIGSNWKTDVKQERTDEAEIQAMAAKIIETNKVVMAKQQQQAAQLANRQIGSGPTPLMTNANGQTNILNYLQKKTTPTTTAANGLTGGAAAAATLLNGRVNMNGGATNLLDTAAQDRKIPNDEESQKGRFGWTTMGKIYIPYIFRQQEKYCSVRMIEMKLLSKYLNYLHPDIYSSCTCVRSYYITEAEARLLIEINQKHCDNNEFGCEIFTQKDLVVRLSDATKFYQFLDICYRKLINGNSIAANNKTTTPMEKCGFIRINKESVVPYTVRNNEQVVPLFYFEGETENLKQKADYLSGWDLAYLKFCCKVQGIRNELFSSENVAVISLTDIKSYFPNGTEFEDYWPSKVVDSNLLIGNNRNNINNSSVNWTRQPTQPPPKATTITATQQSGGGSGGLLQKNSHSAQAATAVAQSQLLNKRNAAAAAANVANAFAAQSVAAATASAATLPGQRMHTNSALAAQQAAAATALVNGSWMSQQQQNNMQLNYAQLMQAQSHNSSRNPQYRNQMETLLLNNRQAGYPYNNAGLNMPAVNSHTQGNAPPPLVRSSSNQNGNQMSLHAASAAYIQQQAAQQQAAVAAAVQHQRYAAAAAAQQQQQQQHQQQQQQQQAAVQHSLQNGRSGGSTSSTTPNGSASNGSSNSSNSASLNLQRHALAAAAAAAAAAENSQRLHVIPEAPVNNFNMPPYKVQKVYVDNQLVPCINMKAYNDSDQLMTLSDFQQYFFPNVPLENCKRLIEALNVELYKGNRKQVQTLMENDRNHNENIPLVRVRDIMKYMTQLKFMISKTTNQDQPPTKRSRVS